MIHPFYVKICKFTRYTKIMTVPAEYARRHGIKIGDKFEWREEPDGSVRLRVLRAEEPQQIPQSETA
jgi:hypothetical protein